MVDEKVLEWSGSSKRDSQKTSPSGIRTAKTDIDLVHQRLKAAQQHYEEHYDQEI